MAQCDGCQRVCGDRLLCHPFAPAWPQRRFQLLEGEYRLWRKFPREVRLQFEPHVRHRAGVSHDRDAWHFNNVGNISFNFGAVPNAHDTPKGNMPLPLNELFPEEDYRFHLTLRKGDLGAFFSCASDSVLEERARWLLDDSGRFAAETEGSEPLIAEFEAMASKWAKKALSNGKAIGTLPERLVALGCGLEPDFMLLSKDRAGIFRLAAGVVCFPSSWALGDKNGERFRRHSRTRSGLNAALGTTIGQFLGSLKPGASFERANWGLSATPELNMHPSLGRPCLASPLKAADAWLRIEDQLFAAMPASGGILFAIRLRVISLSAILDDPQLRSGFRRALATMPESLATYKGIAPVRGALLSLVQRQ